MNFWDRITGSDMTREMNELDKRAKRLPAEYQKAWKEMAALWQYGDFTGRNLMLPFANSLELLETAAAEGRSVTELFDGDIQAFCFELADVQGGKSSRDKWRKQLNKNVSKKLGAAE